MMAWFGMRAWGAGRWRLLGATAAVVAALLMPAAAPARPVYGAAAEESAVHGREMSARLRRVARVNMKQAREIALRGDWAYVCQNLNGMTLLNVRSPSHPRVVSIYGPEMVQAMHAAFADKDLLVIADRFRGLRLWRITSPKSPEELSTFLLPGVPNHVAVFSRSGCRYAAVACGGAGLAIVDITDPRRPQLASTFTLDSDFARRILVEGNVGYLADQFDGGLKILDLTRPDEPHLLLKILIPGFCESVATSGNLLFAGYRQYGTRVLRISPAGGTGEEVTTPTVELLCSLYRTKNRVRNVAPVGSNLLVVADDQAGLDLYDTSDPRLPVLTSEYRFDPSDDGVASSVVVDGRHIYVPSWDRGVSIFEVEQERAARP